MRTSPTPSAPLFIPRHHLRTIATENYPQLVDSLVLVDPVIPKPFVSEESLAVSEGKTDGLLIASLSRRDTWNTRYVKFSLPLL